MKKIVNGIHLECTPEEEKTIIAEWEENRIKQEIAKSEYSKKEEIRKNALEKIKISLGLSDEEINSLF